MEHGKPNQSLAVAYSIKRKNRNKMAKGGMTNESAKHEQRPMPQERDKDAKIIAQNSGKKALPKDQWTDSPTVVQAQHRPKIQPIKHPRMVKSDVISARLRDQEDHLQKLAKGGEINELISMSHAEQDGEEHPAGLEQDNDQMSPSEDEIMADHEQMLAEGGMTDGELEEEHHSSIAAAIMAKKERQMQLDSDSDVDRQIMLAHGGAILSHGSIESDDSDQADLSRNAQEDANEEDQLSWNALRKENYSESEGLDQLDSPEDSNLHGDSQEMHSENKLDKIDRIRAKMKARR